MNTILNRKTFCLIIFFTLLNYFLYNYINFKYSVDSLSTTMILLKNSFISIDSSLFSPFFLSCLSAIGFICLTYIYSSLMLLFIKALRIDIKFEECLIVYTFSYIPLCIENITLISTQIIYEKPLEAIPYTYIDLPIINIIDIFLLLKLVIIFILIKTKKELKANGV